MTSAEDILAAMKKEQHTLLAVAVAPASPITPEDIINDMKEQANPGRGCQKLSSNSRMGAPKPSVAASNVTEKDVKNFFDIPGLKKMLKSDRR